MIFLTVGSQLPFDRLTIAVDTWAGEHKNYSIFGQIGSSNYQPKNIQFCQSIVPDVYNQYFNEAELVISHAGTGGILSALELSKPLLIMPRSGSNMETRNDHQFSTIKYFADVANIFVAQDETEIPYWLNRLLIEKEIEKIPENCQMRTSSSLIDAIRKFVNSA